MCTPLLPSHLISGLSSAWDWVKGRHSDITSHPLLLLPADEKENMRRKIAMLAKDDRQERIFHVFFHSQAHILGIVVAFAQGGAASFTLSVRLKLLLCVQTLPVVKAHL